MFLFIVGVIGVWAIGMFWIFYSAYKADKVAKDLRTNKLHKLTNMYSFVEFVNDSNKIYSSEFFTAEITLDDVLLSSEDKAKEYLDKCFRRGYFQTDDGICIPVSQIKHGRVINKLGV